MNSPRSIRNTPSAGSTSRQKFAREFLLLTGIFAVNFFGSCSSIDTEVKKAVSSQKPASIDMWEKEAGEAGMDMLDGVALNTAILLAGWESAEVQASGTDDGRVDLNYEFKTSSNCSIGSAVPITADGYFLTARHCIEDKPDPREIVVICGNGSNLHAEKHPYRIVWESEDEALDLAIVHAPSRPTKVFTLDLWDSMNGGDLVAATGWSGSQKISRGAGSVLHLQNVPTTLERGDWNEVYHTVPLADGDSGGPLINRYGHLLGINSKFIVNPLQLLVPGKAKGRSGYRGVSIVPDTEMIRRHVLKDRASNRSRR